LYAFENKVLRKILGPKTEEVAKQFSTLHNEELWRRIQVTYCC